MVDTRRQDPGNPIVGLLMLLPILAAADWMLNGGQYVGQALTLYLSIKTALNTPTTVSVAANSVSGSGVDVSPMMTVVMVTVVAVIALLVLANLGRSMNTATVKRESTTTAASDKPAGVGYRHSRKPRTASDLRKLTEV